MEPRQPGARKSVAQKVTVDDRIEKWVRYGLYHNNTGLFLLLVHAKTIMEEVAKKVFGCRLQT